MFLKRFITFVLLFPLSSFAIELEGKFEYVQFQQDDNNTTVDQNTSFMGRFKGNYDNDFFASSLNFFARYDAQDSKRNFIYPEDTFIKSSSGGMKFYYGTRIYNFSATEFFHPADSINSRILNGNLSDVEKIGEPVASLDYPIGQGNLSLMFFPTFMAPRLPSEQSRLGTGLDLKDSHYLLGNGEISDDIFVPQFGAHLTQTFGSTDLGFHLLYHIDRQNPMLAVNTKTFEVSPLYGQSLEFGATVQSAFDSGLIVKAEGAYKSYLSDEEVLTIYGTRNFQNSGAAVLSFEYGLSHENGSDSTFILEGQSMFGSDRTNRDETGFFSRDVMFGYRLAFNDIKANEIFAGLVFDVEREHEYLGIFDYSLRLSDSVKFELGVRYIDAPEKSNKAKGLEILDRDSSIFTNFITYY